MLGKVCSMNLTHGDDRQYWRFWPIVCLSFLYPINNALINLAIPLYYFKQGVPIQTIGILAASMTITYCFSPILFNKVSDKIGRKKSIGIALMGTSFAQLIFYFTLDPPIFFIARLIEGLVMGLYWSNLQATISENAKHDPNKYMAKFNFGWNSGVLSGFLLGALILFRIDDLTIIFYIAPILVFVSLIITLLFFKETDAVKLNRIVLNEYNNGSNLNPEIKNQQRIDPVIPLIMPVLLVVAFSFQKASLNLLYSIKSEILGFDTYTVYLLAFFSLTTQLFSTSLSSYLSIKTLKRVSIICIIALIIINFLFAINSNFLIFIALFFIMGFFAGIIYSFGLKLSILLNAEHKTSKYSSICESSMGLTFLIIPIMSAYIATININYGFYAISFGFVIFLIVIQIFLKKIKI
ncbi:MAG: MFS transporter [Promethearchaeota archaeon]|nr:MAG: MFS transporter [Candidatus Lokiarchaeota archaeon]